MGRAVMLFGGIPLVRRRQIFFFLIIVSLAGCYILLYTNEDFFKSLYKEHRRFFGAKYEVESWTDKRYSACDGNFLAYGRQFAVLKRATILPRSEQFLLPCSNLNNIKYKFDYGKEGTHLNRWTQKLQNYNKSLTFSKTSNTGDVIVVVKRYEYANLYHTMTDWYNVFLTVKLLNLPINKVSVLLMDSFPKGHMDETWKRLFTRIISVYNLTKPLQADTIVWNILGYESPLNYHGLLEVPYVEAFHSFFLSKYDVKDDHHLDCKSPTVVFLWRRDYVAHAGNKAGTVKRKVANEKELVIALKQQYPGAIIKEYNFEKFTFKEQLEIIASTDILISMHGAGLSHILFLPSHAGVIELFPLYWMKFPGMIHFEAFARWRHLKYTHWQNMNPNNEFAQYMTHIPTTVIQQHVNKVYKQMCP